MPPAKFGYNSSVKRGSGSSRKYSFSVPAMAFTSISRIMRATSLLSARQMRHRSVYTKEYKSFEEKKKKEILSRVEVDFSGLFSYICLHIKYICSKTAVSVSQV